jgi:hypothetical protein
MQKLKSKIIQVSFGGEIYEKIVLCEDGSVWGLYNEKSDWECILQSGDEKHTQINYPTCGSRWIKNNYGYEVEVYRAALEDKKTIISFVTDDGEDDEEVLEDFLKLFTRK